MHYHFEGNRIYTLHQISF